MTLSLFPSTKAPISSNLSATWGATMGLNKSKGILGVVLDSDLTGTRYWRKQNVPTTNSEMPPFGVTFTGNSLATGYMVVRSGMAVKQGYIIRYDEPAVGGGVGAGLYTNGLEVDKHYMLGIKFDMSKTNTSFGKVVDNNYSYVTEQLAFEFVEYDPQAADVWQEAPYVRAKQLVEDKTAQPFLMLADINTAASLGSPKITMLNMTYEALKTTKRGEKQLVMRFSSNLSKFPETGQVNLIGKNNGQSTVLLAKYPVNADDPANRIYTSGDANTPSGAHYRTQRIPFLYTSYPQQPYSAGTMGLAYNASKTWTTGLQGRDDGQQFNEYMFLENEASFKCHTDGVYKFDMSVLFYGTVSYNVNNRWHGLAMYIERGANAPVGMRKRIDGVQCNIRDDNYTSGTSGARSNGYGVIEIPEKTLRQEFTVTLYDGDKCFFIVYCDMHDISTYGSSLRGRIEQENLDIWYMGAPTKGNKRINQISQNDFAAGWITDTGEIRPPAAGLRAEVTSKNFYPVTAGDDFTFNYAFMQPNRTDGGWSAVAFYDAAGVFIYRPAFDEGVEKEEGIYYYSHTVKVPAGATQAKLSCRGYQGGGLMSIGDLFTTDDNPTLI